MIRQEFSFSDIMDGFYDGPHATPVPSLEGPVFLGIKNIREEGGIDLSQIRHISEQEYPRWTKRVTPRKDDIVFSYEATLHRYALIPDNFRGCLGRRMALIRANTSLASPRFLYYYFLSPYWRAFLETVKVAGSTVDRISIIDFPKYKIKLPPLPTQKKIASILSAYDDLIDNNKQRIQILEEMAEEIYKEWFVRLRFPGYATTTFRDKNGNIVAHGTEGALPEGWEKVIINDIYETSSGGTPSRKRPGYYLRGKIDWIKTKELSDTFIFSSEEKITESGLKSSSAKIFPKDTVLIGMYGATLGQLGITAVNAATNQACCAFIPKDGSRHYYIYLYHFLKSNRRTFFNLSVGAAQQNISQDVIQKIYYTNPSRTHLDQFKQLVHPLYGNIKILMLQCRLLQQTRDLLLPRLISGKLDVEKLDIPIAT